MDSFTIKPDHYIISCNQKKISMDKSNGGFIPPFFYARIYYAPNIRPEYTPRIYTPNNMPLKRLRLTSETFLFYIGINTHAIKPPLRMHFRGFCVKIPLNFSSKKSEKHSEKIRKRLFKTHFQNFAVKFFNFHRSNF